MPERLGPTVSHPYTTPGTSYVGDVSQPFFRDDLDAARTMWNRSPQAEYPIGYLGTIRTRREDRLQKAVRNQLGQKTYDRGVHVGERVDRSAYFWPDEFSPDRGLVRQATTGLRHAPLSIDGPARLVNDGKSIAPESASITQNDLLRRERLMTMGPAWR